MQPTNILTLLALLATGALALPTGAAPLVDRAASVCKNGKTFSCWGGTCINKATSPATRTPNAAGCQPAPDCSGLASKTNVPVGSLVPYCCHSPTRYFRYDGTNAAKCGADASIMVTCGSVDLTLPVEGVLNTVTGVVNTVVNTAEDVAKVVVPAVTAVDTSFQEGLAKVFVKTEEIAKQVLDPAAALAAGLAGTAAGTAGTAPGLVNNVVTNVVNPLLNGVLGTVANTLSPTAVDCMNSPTTGCPNLIDSVGTVLNLDTLTGCGIVNDATYLANGVKMTTGSVSCLLSKVAGTLLSGNTCPGTAAAMV